MRNLSLKTIATSLQKAMSARGRNDGTQRSGNSAIIRFDVQADAERGDPARIAVTFSATKSIGANEM
ncbi:MAG: hypothetical protein LBG43_03945 [Treponema sp.]|jgi:hypothetical protein|nr:hypothetical protein [Treponema sp.]